jgi:pilus assembly protein CpaE
MNEIRDLRGGKDDTVIDLIVNMVGSAQKHEIPKVDIEAALDRKPSLMLDYKPGLFMAFESEGRKITSSPEGRDIAQTLLQLVAKLIRGAGSDSSGPANDAGGKGLSGILNKFKAKS